MSSNGLELAFQSAYTKCHSTETALLRVTNDLTHAVDQSGAAVLVLLDLSAAFDTIDHEMLLSRLNCKFGVTNMALCWFRSYLSDRYQTVLVHEAQSEKCKLMYGVPQGSVLGPILFNMYTSPLAAVINKHKLQFHSYADDTQIYMPINPRSISDANTAIKNLELCLNNVKLWMQSNMLKVNEEKTELLFISTKQQLSKWQLPSIKFGEANVTYSVIARNLGVTFDCLLNMDEFVNTICHSVGFHLYNIWRIRDCLDMKTAEKVIHAVVSSKLDYCNSLLYGLSKLSLQKLQRIQNRAARILFKESKYSHITPLLMQLHWLPVEQRIIYKVLLIMYKSLNNLAPNYLANLFQQYMPPRSLRSIKKCLLHVPASRLKSFGDRSLMVYGPKIWNDLPQDLRQQTSVGTFKVKLKTYLFTCAFS